MGRIFGLFLSLAIGVGACGLCEASSQVTVYPSRLQQRIDGFGASDAWYAWEIHSFPPATQAAMLNAWFSPTSGAGLSLLRHRVPPEIEPSPGVWDWSQDDDAVWLSRQAIARGVSQVWSTVWSPPAWMKTNLNVNWGGEVALSHYQDYATFLATYLQTYASGFGLQISGISIANEPDQSPGYESSNWTAQQFHDFIANNLMPTFKAAKIQTQVMMPEFSGWSDSLASATLADPVTASFIGIINSHDYWLGLQPFTDAELANKTVWETEVSNLGTDDPSITDGLAWAQVIHHTLVDARANAWHYWWLYSDVSDTTGQSLISGNPATNSYTTKKRLWTIGNFSRFVRPGSHMVSVSSNNPQSGVYVSAFSGPNGALSVVVINANSTASSFTAQSGMNIRTLCTEYRTSSTENLSLVGTVPVTLGNITATLNAQSVTTFSFTPVGIAAP